MQNVVEAIPTISGMYFLKILKEISDGVHAKIVIQTTIHTAVQRQLSKN